MVATASRTGRRWSESSVDALPEFFTYRDEGCEVSPSCLRCPLPQCKYDDPQAHQRELRDARHAPALALLSQGMSTTQVARETGIGSRTVARLKAGAR